MKKTILLGMLAIVAITSCQKESIEPIQQKVTTTNSCGAFDGCWAGTYVCDSTNSLIWESQNPGIADTVIQGLSVQIIADRDTVMNGVDKVHYVLDSVTNNLPYLSINTIFVFNHTWLNKNDPWSSGIAFITKTGKNLILTKQL